jgi:hypothetical protein
MISNPADTANHKRTSDPLLEKELTNELYATTMEELTKHGIETYGFSKVEADLYVADIEEKRQAMKNVEQQALCPDSAEAKNTWHVTACNPIICLGMTLRSPPKKLRQLYLRPPPKKPWWLYLIYPEIPPRRRNQRARQEYYK